MALVRKGFDLWQLAISAFFVVVGLVMIYPFWHALIGSFMGYDEYVRKSILLWVDRPTLANYQHIFALGNVFSPLRVTIFVTIVGTVTSLLFTAVAAYGLSKRFPGSSLAMVLIVITMFVNPGIIPNYMVVRRLGLLNTYWAYLLPHPALINTFNLIVMRTYFAAFSHEVEESALMDGCGYFTIFAKIVLPLSKPILAAIGLFYAVQFWNTFFQSLFYVTDRRLQTLQHYLFGIIRDHESEFRAGAERRSRTTHSETNKLANVIVTVAPIIVVYPFLQKHFAKGVMIGSIKG